MTAVLCIVPLTCASAGEPKENWDKQCTKCHGSDGKGETKMGRKLGLKNLADPKFQSEMKDDEMFKAIKEGIKDKQDVVRMKPAEGLSDDEMKALVQFVRGMKQ